jgi:sugar-specific transcriptional regulator TrmB
MDKYLLKSLEQSGLTDKEAVVYIAALELGRFSVLALSRKTNIKRPTCYVVLDELIKKGLISTFPQAKKVIYVAEHPNTLLKKSADAYQTTKSLMPELQALMNSTSEKPELRVFSGQKGIQHIYELMLDEGHDLHYIASTEELVKSAGAEFLDGWIKRRITKKLKTYRISVREDEMFEVPLYVGSQENLRTVRYAPKGFATPYTIYIFGKKVAFVSTKKDLFGFIVESADLAISMKAMFDVVWSVSSEK